jgi:hypothetical protein
MLKVIIRKSISVPGSVFDIQRFLEEAIGNSSELYCKIAKRSLEEKKKLLQKFNEKCAAAKYNAKVVGAHPYNRCEVYERCFRILS